MSEKTKEKIINTLLNLIKVKSIVTFAIIIILMYLVKNNQIETASVVAIIMMVFQNLFDRNKKEREENKNE